jgi:hypothetical protein
MNSLEIYKKRRNNNLKFILKEREVFAAMETALLTLGIMSLLPSYSEAFLPSMFPRVLHHHRHP